ncbi:MAG TPA: HAMP domain-containing sensor histidine kinase [Egicoccus sp.]|nr:HAMP domain-containing sensor histidine kinase [Egicoccus sp.]HSK23698.1 HAMP domain-containing sensor histidine kinase [Egicoccus sp.]
MRQRLVVSAVALVLTALLAFALPLGWAVRGLLEGRALDALQGRVEPIGLLLDRSRNCAELRLTLVQLADDSITLSAITTDRRVLATTADGPTTVGEEFELALSARPGRLVDDDRMAVALPLSTGVCGPTLLHATTGVAGLHRQIRGAWFVIAGIAATVALTAAAGAWVLGRRLAKPFERLATSADQLGDGDFSARAPRSGLPEADRIADALDDTAERLGRSVARSNAFAADASHQLRTPLTALRLHLEALAAASPGGPSVDAALDEADRLETTIDELVTLTRLDAAPRDLDLAELVRERLPLWEDAADRQARDVVFEALPVPAVRARAGAVAQALQVLLDNALQHGTGTITVRLAPALPDEPDGAVRLCVLDEGPADPDARVEREVTASPVGTAAGHDIADARLRQDRHGRGLPLARALIGAEGGEVTLAVERSGSAACLLLPGARPRT